MNCDNPLLSSQEVTALCLADQDTQTAGVQALGATDDASLTIGRSDIEGGPRVATYEHTSFRTKLGIRGSFNDAWSYDFYGQYYYADEEQGEENEFNLQHVKNALEVVMSNGVPTCKSALPGGSDPACVPWNIFQDGGCLEGGSQLHPHVGPAMGLRRGGNSRGLRNG